MGKAVTTSVMNLSMEDWTLDRIFKERLQLTPDRVFLTFEGQETESFSETYAKAAALARGFAELGLGKGDRIVILAPNNLNAVHAWIAANLLGAIDVPLNPALRGATLEHAVNLVRPKLIAAEDSLIDTIAASRLSIPLTTVLHFPAPGQPPCPAVELDGLTALPFSSLAMPVDDWSAPGAGCNELASIMLTSGTSGPSKGVMISHAQAAMAARQVVEGYRIVADDIHFCPLPLFHMSPRYFAVYAGLLAGAQTWIDRSFRPEHWIDRVRTSKATLTIGHGPLLEMIFAQPERSDDIDNRLVRVGAAPFPSHIGEAFEKRFGVKGIESWGLTEVNMPCWHPYEEPRRPGSCGKVRDDLYEFRVVDPDTDMELPRGEVGEFIVRPKVPWTISPGYFDDPQATTEAWRNLWFHTGDGGYIDQDGWVYFVDRLKDRIRRRAENISSHDIETAAMAYPAVLECAAIGIPSEFASDDDIKLCVVAKDGFSLDPPDLIHHMAGALPHYMVPRYVEMFDTLPRTPTKKLRRAELRRLGNSQATWDRKSAGISLRDLATR